MTAIDAKADARIPVGIAIAAMPRMAITDPNSLPIVVIGYMSPYPTVVNVATAHHIVAGILVKTVGIITVILPKLMAWILSRFTIFVMRSWA